MKGLTDIPGVRAGHASDYEAITGCTAVLFDVPAIGGVDVRGFATGTQELDVLNPLHVTQHIHGFVLAGGSAFGLEAASGVRRFLEAKGVGYATSRAKVPIVPAAILYDLGIGKAEVRPTREMGHAAAAAATGEAVHEGSIGAGTGATVGKVLGMKQAMKGGIGSSTVRLRGKNEGAVVSAMVVVNAVGDVIDPKTAKIVAGTRKSADSREFVGSASIVAGVEAVGFRRGGTVLGIVGTNVALTKNDATALARLANNGMVRAISPAHMISDGDLMFAFSIGTARASIDALGVAAADAVAEAIVRGVREARSLGGVPAVRE